VGLVTIDEDTYGPAGAAFYDEFFPINESAAKAAALLAEVARETGADNPIALELGIGTGRVAIPLAGLGIKVYGVDLAPAMLGLLRAKPGADGIHATLGDMTDPATLSSVSEGVRYDLVYCVFGTLTALPDAAAQRRCLRAAAGVLAPGGRVVLEMPIPDLSTFDRHRRRVRHLGRHGDGTVVETCRLDPVAQTMDFEVTVLSSATGVAMQAVKCRYMWPSELDLMAELVGLQPVARHGDWSGGPLRPDSAIGITVYSGLSS
jgi:SAM-dependent methyltransferase